MDVTLVKAQLKDAIMIHGGQREAFLPMLERYQDEDTDPANESLENIQKAIREEIFYKIMADGQFAGALMIEREGRRRLKLHTLYIKPALQNRGIGGRAIDIAEKLHADTAEWTLNTPADLENNRRLYEKKGYKKRGQVKINDALTLSCYSKAGDGAPVYEAAKSRRPEQGEPLVLKKGQSVKVGEAYEGPEGWNGWYRCTSKDGISGWAPESVIDGKGTEAVAAEDYSSSELSIEAGEMLKGIRETGGWILCENSTGERGWVPEECLSSANDKL